MVNASFIDIHTLTLDELSGVVNLYPWYGAARVELCRRMLAMGGDSWGMEQFAQEALYIPDRGKLALLARHSSHSDCSDKDVQQLLASYMEPALTQPSASGEEQHAVRAVGGDYFSQAQYDNVRQSGDNIFSRMAGKIRSDGTPGADIQSDLPERFATETLARIFVEQGRTEEARRIYSRLILDFPEKSAYFATLIEKLEN